MDRLVSLTEYEGNDLLRHKLRDGIKLADIKGQAMGILAMLLHPRIQALLTAAHSSHLDISFEQFVGHGLTDTGGGSDEQYMLIGEAHNCVCSVVCRTGLLVGKEVLVDDVQRPFAWLYTHGTHRNMSLALIWYGVGLSGESRVAYTEYGIQLSNN